MNNYAQKIDVWGSKDTDDYLHYMKSEIFTGSLLIVNTALLLFFNGKLENYKEKNIKGCEKYVCIDEDQFLSIQLLVWFIVFFRGVVGYYYLKSLG